MHIYVYTHKICVYRKVVLHTFPKCSICSKLSSVILDSSTGKTHPTMLTEVIFSPKSMINEVILQMKAHDQFLSSFKSSLRARRILDSKRKIFIWNFQLVSQSLSAFIYIHTSLPVNIMRGPAELEHCTEWVASWVLENMHPQHSVFW